MLKLIDTTNITFEMEQAYMLNRGARLCIRKILENAPEVDPSNTIILKSEPKTCEISGAVLGRKP